MLAGVVSLLLLGAVPEAADAPVVVLADGRAVAATSWSIDAAGRLIVQEAGQPDASKWTPIESPALLDVDLPAARPAWPETPGARATISLASGEVLHAVIVEPDSPGTIRIESGTFGPQRLAIEQVSRITLADRVAARPGGSRAAEAPCVLLVNGDLIAGAIKSVTPAAVTVDSEFGEAKTELGQVLGIEVSRAAPGADGRAPGQVVCALADGQRWYADRLEPGLGKDRCRIRRAGNAVDVAVRDIRQLVFAGWTTRELVALDPPKVQTTSYLGEPVRVQIDDATHRRPRLLGGRSFVGGITARPRSLIRYPLTGGPAYLVGRVGLDPLRGGDGVCDVRVEAGGKSLVRFEKLTVRDGPRRIATPIDAGDGLSLVTDFGPRAEVGDCVNWCELALVAKSQSKSEK